jgi:hypothetical protein
LRYPAIYPGVDLHYHLSGNDIEFDFEAENDADVSRIRLRFDENVRISAQGDLLLSSGAVRRPAAWQTVAGVRRPVPVSFRTIGRRRAGFRLGPHDRTVPVVIDPRVDFATIPGGSAAESDTQMIVDSAGSIYMAGTTFSVDFPASELPGSLLNAPESLLKSTVYVTRLRPDASAIDWSFFIGGTASQNCAGLAQDSLGDVYVFGATTSANFPVTPGAWKTSISPRLNDEFVVKMDAGTGMLKASTYLGLQIITTSFAVDSAGGVYAAGIAFASFQPTPGAYLTSTSGIAGFYDAVGILRLNASLTNAVYATYMDIGVPSLLQADPGGNLIFTGTAGFVNPPGAFPAVNPIPGINQTPQLGGQGFIAKLNAFGSGLVYASLLYGNGGQASATDLQVDSAGNA